MSKTFPTVHVDTEAEPRSRRHQQEVAAILNSLQRIGRLILDDPNQWDLGYHNGTLEAALDAFNATLGVHNLTLINHNGRITTLEHANGGGNGGGGSSITFGPIASRPAASTNGTVYLASDLPVLYRDNGTAWTGFGPVFQLTAPPSGNWTVSNHNGFSGTTLWNQSADGSIFLSDEGTSGDHKRALVRTLPTRPYNITIGFLPWYMVKPGAGSDYPNCGVMLRNSANDTIYTFSIGAAAGSHAIAIYSGANSNTSASVASPDVGVSLATPPFMPGIAWFRISENGTNRIFSTSSDGINFNLFFKENSGNVTFAADQVGIYVNLVGGSKVTIRMLSYKEEP